MVAEDPRVKRLLPADGADWVPVGAGASGAVVLHDRDGARYAKLASPAAVDALAAERHRTEWLDRTGVPTTSVLDWRVTDDGACLVTRTVPGVSADRLEPDALRGAWDAIADVVRALHDLPATTCPFEWGVDGMVRLARETVRTGRVQAQFLPADLQDVDPATILGQLEDQLPHRRRQEREEVVVCHGDLCLPNVLVDPETFIVTGLIDVGRLERADPYADISLLLANARGTWPDEHTARRADTRFAERYGIELDGERQRFYLSLDPLTWPLH